MWYVYSQSLLEAFLSNLSSSSLRSCLGRVRHTLSNLLINPYHFTGILFPEGLKYLKNAEDREEVRRICERFGPYKDLYNGVGDGPNDKTLEDKFFEEEVKLIRISFKMYFVILSLTTQQ